MSSDRTQHEAGSLGLRPVLLNGAGVRALFLGALVAPAFGLAAHGQTQAASSPPAVSEIPELVVTSRRITEDVQTTGVSVAVFTGQKLDDLGITSLADVSRYAPNIMIEQKSGSAAQGLTIKIRGIGVSVVDYIYSDPSVALYVDGVFEPRSRGPQADLFDLDRVEILRGPQGTLFGKNALGGAINLITKKPDNHTSAEFSGEIGDYNTRNFSARVNDVIVDGTLFASLSATSLNHDGYYKNTYESGEDAATGDRQALRAAIRWLPTPHITVDLTSDVTLQRASPFPFRLEALTPGSEAAVALSSGGFTASNYIVGRTPSPSTLSTVALNFDEGVGTFLPADKGERGRNEDNALFAGDSLIVSDDLTSTISVKSITGYRELDQFLAADLDGTPAAIADQVKSDKSQSASQEFQFNGKFFDNRLDLVAGVFGYTESAYENQTNGFYLGLADTIAALQTVSSQNIRRYDNRALAGFTHAIFNVTDKFRLTAGIRYSWERKEMNEADGHLVTPSTFTLVTKDTKAWESLTPQFGAEYSVMKDLFTYVTISKGYASGGFSSALAAIGGLQQYNPESLWNYEGGFKSEFFHHTLQLNASAFYMDYSNIVIQSFTTTTTGVPVNLYSNAGRAEVKGIDADFVWRPIVGLVFTTGLGLLNQKFLDYGIGANGAPIPPSSAHFFDSPDVTASSTIVYTQNLEQNRGEVTAEAGWSYRDRTYFDNLNAITSSQGAYSLFDAHLTYGFPGGHLSAQFYGENLTNKVYVLRTTNALSSLGVALAQFGMPQVYGLKLKFKY